MLNGKGHRAAYVVRDEQTAMLLVDPMRRTILNLLADRSFTESQLSGSLGLTDASIGHHLRILLRSRLIKVEKRELESHGIMQNFYRSVALCIVVDTERMSKTVAKYFFPINIERIRGALAALSKRRPALNSKELDTIAEDLAIQIAKEASKLGERKVLTDRETTAVAIYGRALVKTMKPLTVA